MANKEIGYTGLAQWSGRIQEDFLRELRGKEGFKRFNEMRLNSPIVGALLLAIEQSIRSVTWNYVSDLGEDDPRIEFLEEARTGMSSNWNDHVSSALTMLPFGYAPFEIVYDREDGKIVWRKFALRGQDTIFQWKLDENGGMEGLVQMGAPVYKPITIPIDKMVLYRTRVEKNNPEGRSILRTAWVPYYYAKNIMRFEGIGIERDFGGFPVIEMPKGADTDETSTTSDASKAAKLVRNIRVDEQAGLVLPFGWKFELASTQATRLFDTDKIIKRYESRILMSCLAQFLNLGQDQVGTQALSKDLTDFWGMSVNATADIISETHTKYAVTRLLALNGMDPEGIRLEHTPAGDTDLAALADFFQKVGSKVTWLPSDEVWLRGVANLPDADVDLIVEERERKADEAQFMPFTAEHYGAGEPPDNEERLKSERRLERLVKAFMNEQKDRIVKETTK